MASQQPITSKLPVVLADQHCRSIISHFQNTSEEVATVANLTSQIEAQTDEKQIAAQLHHSTLPRLEDVGILEYDARSKTVRYHRHLAPQLMDDIETLCEMWNI